MSEDSTIPVLLWTGRSFGEIMVVGFRRRHLHAICHTIEYFALLLPFLAIVVSNLTFCIIELIVAPLFAIL